MSTMEADANRIISEQNTAIARAHRLLRDANYARIRARYWDEMAERKMKEISAILLGDDVKLPGPGDD